MREVLHNMLRRKMRTTLTVMGIFIGVLALTVMGAMAERMNFMVKGSEQYFGGQITVVPGETMGYGRGFILPQVKEEIQAIDGVAGVARVIEVLLDSDMSGMHMGPPPSLHGIDFDATFQHPVYADLRTQTGRFLTEADRGAAVAGADIAATQHWRVGDTIRVRDQEFELVGILERMMTIPDQYVFLHIHDARDILVNTSPLLRTLQNAGGGAQEASGGDVAGELFPTGGLNIDELATGLSVAWEQGVDPRELSDRIQAQVADVSTLSPEMMQETLNQALVIFNLVIVGSAVIALLVGGLSVVNTMTMSVSERKTEIGLKKALGAPTGAILREYLSEAGVIGLVGGVLGILAGSVIAMGLNHLGAASNTQVFEVTPRLMAFSLAFATGLGMLAGLFPALHAARMNPVQALRDE